MTSGIDNITKTSHLFSQSRKFSAYIRKIVTTSLIVSSNLLTHFTVDSNFHYIVFIYYHHQITVRMLILFFEPVVMLLRDFLFSFIHIIFLLLQQIVPIILEYYVLNSIHACKVLQLGRNYASSVDHFKIHVVAGSRIYNMEKVAAIEEMF